MSDFIEQEVSVTSPPELSQDTPTVSDNLPGTNVPPEANASTATDDGTAHNSLEEDTDPLSLPELTAATIAVLAPYREGLN